MKTFTVLFIPDNRSVQVDEGVTIAEAAAKADVFINNLCGGEGVCGQCKVQVTKGRVEPEEHAGAFFSEEELDEGFVLACQTEIHDDLEVVIPPESRLEDAQIMTEEARALLVEHFLRRRRPRFQYRHPCSTEPRPDDGRPDLGAYELAR